jgi:hypothetical protein
MNRTYLPVIMRSVSQPDGPLTIVSAISNVCDGRSPAGPTPVPPRCFESQIVVYFV